MKTLYIRSISLLLSLQFTFGCDLQDNEVQPTNEWARVYESGEFTAHYQPLDIQPSPDGGALILAEAEVGSTDFSATYLLKVNAERQAEWQHLSETYVRPVSILLPAGKGSFTLVTGNRDQLGTHVLSVDALNEESLLSPVAYFSDYTHPLAANGSKSEGYTILFWDNESVSQMQLALVNEQQESWHQKYNIYENVEPQIMGHLTRNARNRVPFLSGKSSSGYYFNGFNNFTLALTFLNTSGEQQGVVNGTRYASGISQVLPLGGQHYAVARHTENGEIVLSPNTTLPASGATSAGDLTGYSLPNLEAYSRVIIKESKVLQESVTFYAATTKNGRVALYAYDKEGFLLGTHYLGSSNRFEAGAMAFTTNGNLLVLGRTYVAGRFSRLCLFNVPYQTVVKLAGK